MSTDRQLRGGKRGEHVHPVTRLKATCHVPFYAACRATLYDILMIYSIDIISIVLTWQPLKCHIGCSNLQFGPIWGAATQLYTKSIWLVHKSKVQKLKSYLWKADGLSPALMSS